MASSDPLARLVAGGHFFRHPWLDTRRIAGGATWTTEIEHALDEAEYVLALMTSGSYISEVCRAEQLRACSNTSASFRSWRKPAPRFRCTSKPRITATSPLTAATRSSSPNWAKHGTARHDSKLVQPREAAMVLSVMPSHSHSPCRDRQSHFRKEAPQ
jgi:hypothetical protein